MTENIVTMASNRNYREGWDRIFGGNLWKCPECGRKFDYGGKSYCYDTGKDVRLVKVKK